MFLFLGHVSQQCCLSTRQLGLWDARAGPARNGGGSQPWEEGGENCSNGWDHHQLTSSCFLSLTEAEPEVSEKAQVLAAQETTTSSSPRNCWFDFWKTFVVWAGSCYPNNMNPTWNPSYSHSYEVQCLLPAVSVYPAGSRWHRHLHPVPRSASALNPRTDSAKWERLIYTSSKFGSGFIYKEKLLLTQTLETGIYCFN